jgi:hypothetical protein
VNAAVSDAADRVASEIAACDLADGAAADARDGGFISDAQPTIAAHNSMIVSQHRTMS